MPTLRKRVRILTADVSGMRSNLLCFKNVDLLCPTEREVREALHDFRRGSTTSSTRCWRTPAQSRR